MNIKEWKFKLEIPKFVGTSFPVEINNTGLKIVYFFPTQFAIHDRNIFIVKNGKIVGEIKFNLG